MAELDFAEFFDKNDSGSSNKKISKDSANNQRKLRIVKCCGTCRYFWYRNGKLRSGWCRKSNPNAKVIPRTSTIPEADLLWDRTHCLCICNQYKGYPRDYFSWLKEWVNLDGQDN